MSRDVQTAYTAPSASETPIAPCCAALPSAAGSLELAELDVDSNEWLGLLDRVYVGDGVLSFEVGFAEAVAEPLSDGLSVFLYGRCDISSQEDIDETVDWWLVVGWPLRVRLWPSRSCL